MAVCVCNASAGVRRDNLYRLDLCQLDTARVILKEGTSNEKDWSVAKPVVSFLD